VRRKAVLRQANQASGASCTKILIELEDRDWRDICEIMRTLTWGKHEISDKWHAMRERIEQRMLVRHTTHVNVEDLSPAQIEQLIQSHKESHSGATDPDRGLSQ